jgi:hypothetical protein
MKITIYIPDSAAANLKQDNIVKRFQTQNGAEVIQI